MDIQSINKKWRLLFPGYNLNVSADFARTCINVMESMSANYIDSFSEGIAVVSRDYKKYGFISDKGKIIAPLIYEKAWYFNDGFAKVKKDGKWLLLNKDGREITLEKDYQDIGRMQCRRCKATTKIFQEEEFLYGDFDSEEEIGWWGYLDECGCEVIPTQYIYARDFVDGYASVCRGGWKKTDSGLYQRTECLWGVIDVNGNEVIPCRHDDISHFYAATDIFKVHTGGWKNGAWGVMNKQGEWLAPPIFNNIGDEYSNGIFDFYEYLSTPPILEGCNKLYGIYDIINQKILFEPQFISVTAEDGLFTMLSIDDNGNVTKHTADYQELRSIYPRKSAYCN